MSKILPFKAVTPSINKISLVSCRNYDDYSLAELTAWLDYNPYSFLHVLNPAYSNVHKDNSEKRFKNVSHKYQEFVQEKILIKEEKPVFFIYEIENKEHKFTGIIAATSIDDYKKGIIKKHEDTLKYKVDLFKDYMHITNFNTEPVLITYSDKTEINNWITFKKKTTPTFQFSTTTKEEHSLWKIDTISDVDWLKTMFEEIPYLYIADGHHRSASAELLFDENIENVNENLKYFMSFLIPESNLKIYEYNRLIRDLNGHSSEKFIKLIAENFIIKDLKQEIWSPKDKNEFGMYLDGNFYQLNYKYKNNSKVVLNSLDTQILYDKILKPILGIEDLRNDDRIEYLSGKNSILKLKEKIDNSNFKVGFTLFPINIEEIKTIADNNQIMPPKSTYIEPKFRCGLIVYELE